MKNLTENEIRTETQLKEEKERYRVAVESSNDLFFTYRDKAHTLEIVNSKSHDGVWDIKKIQEDLIAPGFSMEDLCPDLPEDTGKRRWLLAGGKRQGYHG